VEGYAYVVSHDIHSYLHVIDISDPRHPTIAGCREVPGYRDVAVSGNYAFVGNSIRGLSVIDVSDPYDPQIVASLDAMGGGASLTLTGSVLYLGDGSAGVRVIDVGDPLHPRIIGGVDTPGMAGKGAGRGDLLCLTDGGTVQVLPAECGALSETFARPDLPSTVRLAVLPNPASRETALSLRLTHQGLVRATLFDAAGREVRIVSDGVLTAGRHDLFWDGRNEQGHVVSSGAYLVRVTTPDGTAAARVILLP
jgi:hypothetical protein